MSFPDKNLSVIVIVNFLHFHLFLQSNWAKSPGVEWGHNGEGIKFYLRLYRENLPLKNQLARKAETCVQLSPRSGCLVPKEVPHGLAC